MKAVVEQGLPEIISLGCRLNIVESEAMRNAALKAGQRDLVIVNTCAVTAEAVRQARQTIRRLKRDNPARRIVVTGCAAQTEPETFAELSEVDQIIGNDIKLHEKTWAELIAPSGFGIEAEERVRVNDIMSVRETIPHLLDGFEGHTRAIVQVQNGCDHRCTFCIIPFGRGNSRSVPMGDIVQQIEKLVHTGYPEIVLTGVDLTSYGQDLPGTPRLGNLIAAILRHVPDLKRLRLSSIDSIEADPLLVELLVSEQRLLPHLHLSLQAGDDLILKRMKRRHSREDAIRFCSMLREKRPEFAFGADLIAGFPTETTEMFENSVALIRECGLTFLHVFPYSPRKGTPAARMPQVDKAIIKQRAARLREVGNLALASHLQGFVGTTQRVLAERGKMARLDDFTPVSIRGEEASMPVSGSILTLAISGHDGQRLVGVPAMTREAQIPAERRSARE